MTFDDIAQDGLDLVWFEDLLDIADMADGSLAVTTEGRLVVYGSPVDAVSIAAEQPYSTHFVEALGEHVLGFKF